MSIFLLGNGVREVFNHLSNHSFGPRCSIVGNTQGCVIGQPDIQIKPILDVFGKELGLKPRTKQSASDKEDQGPTEDSPTVFYGFADESVVEAVKSPLPHLLDSR